MQKLKTVLFDKNSGKLKTNVIVAAGILGILLIFLSGIDFEKDDESYTPTAEETACTSTEEYRDMLEADLEKMLSSIYGAGRVDVMISLDGTTEYVYAQQVQSSSDVANGETASEYRNELVLLDTDKGTAALVTKVLHPRVSGVLIVCDGGGDIVLTEKLINSAAAALGISTANICVAQKAK